MPKEPEKKKVTIGEGFKVMPKAIQIGGRWYKVDPEAWELYRNLNLRKSERKRNSRTWHDGQGIQDFSTEKHGKVKKSRKTQRNFIRAGNHQSQGRTEMDKRFTTGNRY